MCFEIFFAKCKKTLGKEAQRASLPSVKKTLGKELLCRGRLCRVPEKQHSANHLTLGKEPVSGSVSYFLFLGLFALFLRPSVYV